MLNYIFITNSKLTGVFEMLMRQIYHIHSW